MQWIYGLGYYFLTRSWVTQLVFRQQSLQEVQAPARSLQQLICVMLGSGLAKTEIMASEGRGAPVLQLTS